MPHEFIVLVNEQDRETGQAEKMEVHREGWLHRAFSIFIFTPAGEMLLQRRALDKYHCGGLWTNACCSHPRPGEKVEEAARRRLQEELGIGVELQKIFHFTYRAEFENGLTEHEFDHVFVGEYAGEVPFNEKEVMDTRYLSTDALLPLVEQSPETFTPWFRIALPRVMEWRRQQKKSE